MRLYEGSGLYVDLLGNEIQVSIHSPLPSAPFSHAVATVPASGFLRGIAKGSGAWAAAKRSIREQAESIRRLKRDVTHARENNERRNRQLDALGFVWCDGGCKGGMTRYGDLAFGLGGEITAQHIAVLCENTSRALSWFVSREYRRSGWSKTAVADATALVAAAIPAAYRRILTHWTSPWRGAGPGCTGVGEDSIP